MKKILFILIIGLVLGCANETASVQEVDIDATVEARVAKELGRPTPTPKPRPTPTPKPRPTSTPETNKITPKPTIPAPTPTPQRPDIIISSLELSEVYQKNKIAADNKYKNLNATVYGEIVSIEERQGNIEIGLDTADITDIGYFQEVVCKISSSNSKEIEKLINVEIGNKVAFDGRVIGIPKTTNIVLEPCEFTKPLSEEKEWEFSIELPEGSEEIIFDMGNSNERFAGVGAYGHWKAPRVCFRENLHERGAPDSNDYYNYYFGNIIIKSNHDIKSDVIDFSPNDKRILFAGNIIRVLLDSGFTEVERDISTKSGVIKDLSRKRGTSIYPVHPRTIQFPVDMNLEVDLMNANPILYFPALESDVHGTDQYKEKSLPDGSIWRGNCIHYESGDDVTEPALKGKFTYEAKVLIQVLYLDYVTGWGRENWDDAKTYELPITKITLDYPVE
tara:strand:- start:101 stop:1444 length:1344 start_codon:yes stop_codon:yes gene_type:complete